MSTPMPDLPLPDVADHLARNPALALARDGAFGVHQFARLWRGEFVAQTAEVAAFAALAARYPRPGPAGLFLDTARSVLSAREPLLAAAAAIGGSVTGPASEPTPFGFAAFAGFISWLGIGAGPGAAALALRNDLLLWCGVCAALAEAVGNTPPPAVTGYLAMYATPPVALISAAEEVARAAMAEGEDPSTVLDASTRVEPVLTAFWSSVADRPHEHEGKHHDVH